MVAWILGVHGSSIYSLSVCIYMRAVGVLCRVIKECLAQPYKEIQTERTQASTWALQKPLQKYEHSAII